MFAVGRFQLIPSTLKEAVSFLKIEDSSKFDKELQDQIFDYLIRHKRPKIIKYLEGNGSLEEAMYVTAMEWASVAVEKDKRISSKGGSVRYSNGTQSYYAGDGLNKAHINVAEIRKALKESKSESAPKSLSTADN